MKSVKKIKLLFWLSAGFIFLASTTFLFMPLTGNVYQPKRTLTIVLGATLWLSSIASYILLIAANIERRWFIKHKTNGDLRMNCLPGIISFFSNIPATISDVVMFTSFVAFVVIAFTKWKNEYISYVLLFMFYLSLNLHCMFNGRIYKSTKFKRARRDCSYD